MTRAPKAIEERYQRIIAAVSDYVYSVRLVDGRPVETVHGAGCAAVTGYTSQEFAADPYLWFRMVAEVDRQTLQAHTRRIQTGEDPGALEHRIIRKDGAQRWIRNTPVLQRDDQGRLISYDGIIQDITAHKLAEGRLKESEERFKAQYQSNPTPTFTWRGSGKHFELVDYNRAAYALTSGQVERFVGKSSAELYGARPDIIEDLERCAATGEVQRRELQSRNFLPGRVIAVTYAFVPPDLVMVHVEDITERQRAEEELKTSEERFRTLFENAIEGIYRSSLDGRLLLANPALARMFGYGSPQEAMEHTTDIGAQIYADPEERGRVIRRLLKEGEITGYEVTFKHADGALVWVVLNFHLVRDTSGNPLYIEGTCVDITERKRAEKELRRREEKFLKAFQSGPVLMAISNIADGRYLEVNERFAQTLGYDRAEAIGKTSVELGIIDVETRNRMRIMVMEQGAVHEMEMRIRTRHGEIRDGLMSAEVIDLEGQHFLLTMFQDITARKRMEQELRESEERLQALANAAFEAVFFSENGVCMDVNEVAAQMTGYSREELIGMKVSELATPETRPVMVRQIIMKSEEPYTATGLRKDGSRFPAELRGRMFTYRGREVRATAVRDVSERARAEQALKQSEEKYRTLVENARVAVMKWDMSGNITFINEYGLGFFGYAMEELVGRNLVGTIVPETESTGRDLVGMIAEIRRDPERFSDNENENIAKDGRRVWMHWSNKAILNEAGELVGVLSIGSDITARKRAEQELQDWMQRYELIVEASGQVAYDYIVPTGHIAWGASLEKVLGLQPEEMNGGFEQWAELLHPEDRDATLRSLEAAEQACAYWEDRYRMRHKDGEYRWIRDRGFFLPGPDGKAYRMLGMMEDITAAQKDEAELTFRATLLATLQEASFEGILVVDAHGRILSYNRRFVELWGFPNAVLESRMNGHALQAALGKVADPEGFLAKVRSYYTHPAQAGRDEVMLVDGRTLDRYTAPVQGEDGTHYGRVWYYRDITEEKKAAQALRQSEEKYRSIFENAIEGIYQTSPEGRYLSINPAFARMFGFASPEEMMAGISDIGHMQYMHPEERQRLKTILAEDNHVENFEAEVYRRDGTTFWISINASTVRDQQGRLLYYEGSTIDITERRAAEERLRGAVKRLEDIIEFLPDATFIMDRDKRIIAWNRAMEEMTGAPKVQMLGQDRYQGAVPFYGVPRSFLMDLVDKDDAQISALYQNVTRKGAAIQAEVFVPALYHGRGAYIWAAASPLFDGEGNIVGAIESVRDITEAKQAEEALKHSEELFRLIVEHMVEGLALQRVVYDADGRAVDYEYLIINPAMERITGVPVKSFIGRKASEVFPPGYGTYLDVFLPVVETGEPITFEMYSAYLGKHLRVSAYRPAPGQFATVLEDITERKRSEEALKASEELHRLLTENAQDMISRHAADGMIQYVSPACRRLLGYDPEEITGQPVESLVHPDDLAGVWETINNQVRDRNSSYMARHRTLCKDGSWVWVETVGRLIYNPDDTLKEIHCAVRDISERMRSEEALRTSETFLSSIIDQSPSPMWISDERGTLIRVNQALLDTLHISEDELLGKYNIFQDNIVEEQGFMPLVRRVYEQGKAARFELKWNSALLEDIKFRESVALILDVTIFPIRDARGKMTNAVILHQDITARKRAQAELEALDRELKRKNQELESIVYATSHDLRSPLLNIQGFGKRLEKGCEEITAILKSPDVPPQIRQAAVPLVEETIPKALKFIRSSVEKMDSLIKGLLQLSRLGRAVLNMQTVDMAALIHQVTSAMGFQIQEAGVSIEIGDLPACRCDASQMSQVFSNLIDNALKYRSPKRPLRVRIEGEVKDGQCIFTVHDNGIGIPAEHREKIWELFHRLEPGGQVAGEGLGLTVVRRIIDRHGGRIWVEEAPEHGSRFCFMIKQNG